MPPATEYSSDFFFWGARTYVQGSHIVDQLLAGATALGYGTPDKVSASLRHKIHSQGTYVYAEDAARIQERGEPAATFLLSAGNTRLHAALLPGAQAVTRRIADDEKDLMASAIVDTRAKTATLADCPIPRWITVVVALTKRLHLDTFRSEGFDPWMYVQSDISLVDLENRLRKGIRITMTHWIASRMTKSTVYFGDREVGAICFNRKVRT